MPNQPKTPARTVRVPDELWQAAKEAAERNNWTVSQVINDALHRYVTREQRKQAR